MRTKRAKRVLTDEQRLALRERLARGRATAAANRSAKPEVEAMPASAPVGKYGLPPDVVARIRREQQEKIAAELRQIEKSRQRDGETAFAAEELQRLRREAGLTDHLDDLIEHTINVAPFADGITIDGVKYHQGYTYTFTRRQYQDIAETEARGWDSEDRAGNPNKKQYRRDYAARGGRTMNPNALVRQDASGAFLHGVAGVNGKTGATVGAPSDDPVDAVVRALR